MSLYPADDKARKLLPIFKMITGYFPKALREITTVCVANNVRYNPDKSPADINWARGKSPDQLGSLFRHIAERTVDGKIFEETPQGVAKATGITRVYVLAEAAWRALAALELEIEAQEGPRAEEAPPTEAPRLFGARPTGLTPAGKIDSSVAVARGAEALPPPVVAVAGPVVESKCAYSGVKAPVRLCSCDPCCKARSERATGV